MLDQLSAKYPRSYLLKLERASALMTLNRLDEAYAVFDNLLKDPMAASARDLIHYQYAEALARNREHKRAAAEFTAACQVEKGDANLATVSRLRAGQMYDLAGNRQEAVTQYKEVLARPNVYDTKQQAERGLTRPFMGK
jgi:tetratricopeptide (TPR) repeat protein